jgi:hypothetical protein
MSDDDEILAVRADQLPALHDAITRLRQAWENAYAVQCARLNAVLHAVLHDRGETVFLPETAAPPGLTWETACYRLARAIRLLDPFDSFYPPPAFRWLHFLNTGWNPDQPGRLDDAEDALRRYNFTSVDARREIVGPTMAHAKVVRETLYLMQTFADEETAKIAPEQPHADGPEGGCWVWWQNKRHDVPTGNVYKLLLFMWRRDSAAYADLIGPVFDDDVAPQTIRSLAHKAGKVLKRIGIPWRFSADSVSRYISRSESLQNPSRIPK